MAAYDSWRFEVSSADPDATPVWVNLTSRVRTVGAGLRPAQIRRGASTERDDVQPSTLALALENTDHALTPGNPSSPYAAWWGSVAGVGWSRRSWAWTTPGSPATPTRSTSATGPMSGWSSSSP
ncbi:hypothetical protein ACQEUV_33000 [Micromonospora aurantiaca (nom. illeg.)]|uniref:hypothetical protein n=1 Tax=Micromonospora aurantiaca (nom. illeg.) TaxID=47850 RepID=UPI003DA5C2BE